MIRGGETGKGKKKGKKKNKEKKEGGKEKGEGKSLSPEGETVKEFKKYLQINIRAVKRSSSTATEKGQGKRNGEGGERNVGRTSN